MGFTIFESSGTFNPATYGLSAGDTVHVVVVGGGGAGSGYNTSSYSQSNGSASSFGSYCTAAGGNGGIYNTTPTVVTGSNAGTIGQSLFPGVVITNNTSYPGSNTLCGGIGANGWLPDRQHIPMISPSEVVAAILGTYRGTIADSKAWSQNLSIYEFNIPIAWNASAGSTSPSIYSTGLAQTKQAGNGSVYTVSISPGSICIGGWGGIGYGAGGGGTTYRDYYQSVGGSSGVIKHADIVLTSTADIPVTVGAGGAGRYTDGANRADSNGAGADGCVAVFW